MHVAFTTTFLYPSSTCQSIHYFINLQSTTEIYTLSLHDALPISPRVGRTTDVLTQLCRSGRSRNNPQARRVDTLRERSEEHTSELQSRPHLVCRLLLEKKKKHKDNVMYIIHTTNIKKEYYYVTIP